MISKLSNSGLVFIFLCCFILVFRLTHINKKEISWDVLGYYLYLPASFIHHDPMLHDISWLKKLNDEQNLTGTLYQLSSNEKGDPMYFFLMGMALFYLPFFILGYGFAFLSGNPLDGFSPPFQYSLVVGGIIYTIIGLFFFRKILKSFFSESITCMVMVIIVLGTNYIHHLTVDNLATVNVLFMLSSILVWNTIQWHENKKAVHMMLIGLCIFMMGLVKPSEIVIIILPLLWNVFSYETLKQKLQLLKVHWKQILATIGICFLLALPQMLYWHAKTGKFIFDSYKNPGVGLDFFSPHFLDTLFSYRKGWLLYTPVMGFSVMGFYFLYKRNVQLFFAITCYFIVSFYIIASWSEWWYGAAYSTRPMIAMYTVLGICLGYFLQAIKDFKLIYRGIIGLLIVLFIFLNQFQWWQFRTFLLDPYRTTKNSYWCNFLKTNPDPGYSTNLLVERDFTGGFNFKNPEDYNMATLSFWTFDGSKESNVKLDSSGNSYYQMQADQEFSKTFQYKFKQLTDKDHVWLEASVDVRFPKDFPDPLPSLVMSMEHKGGIYGYHTSEIKNEIKDGNWHAFKIIFLTPEMRSDNDVFKCYIWKRGKKEFDIDNFKLDVYEHK